MADKRQRADKDIKKDLRFGGDFFAAFAARGKRSRSKRQDIAASTFARYFNIRAYAQACGAVQRPPLLEESSVSYFSFWADFRVVIKMSDARTICVGT